MVRGSRTDYIKNAAVSYAEMERRGVMIPVTGISCKYRQPSRYDDTLEITTYVTRFSPARVEFRYECRRKGSRRYSPRAPARTHSWTPRRSGR